MGIGSDLAEAIVREHSYKPLYGDVLQIGRQTVYLTPKAAIEMLERHQIAPPNISASEQKLTKNRIATDLGGVSISDQSFFNLLGVEHIKALDHSDYEGAEVIHDLNEPLPVHLRETADFIVDGSTLDNVFSPSLTIKSLAEMLRPGGRLMAVNAWSAHPTAYVLASPLWLLDYFVVNKFADCKVYVVVYIPPGANAFYCDPRSQMKGSKPLINFSSPHEMVTIMIAEKGASSTSDKVPIQGEYRSDADWDVYRENLSLFALSARPHIVRSRDPLLLPDPGSGHLFVDTRYQAVEPLAYIRNREDLLRQAAAEQQPVRRIPRTYFKRAAKAAFRSIGLDVRWRR